MFLGNCLSATNYRKSGHCCGLPPTLGKSNLVVNGDKSFDIKISWHVFGNLVPLWLTALSVSTKNWVVTAYAESQGPGDEKRSAA